MRRQLSRCRVPASVSATDRVVRLKSRICRCSSSAATTRVTEAGERPNRFAALAKLCCSATATKIINASRRSCMIVAQIETEKLVSGQFYCSIQCTSSASDAIRARKPPMTAIHYHTVEVHGLKIFYREAGEADAPALLLLHGFPSAGHMFRDLIPLLADRFHIIAPDLPGFGQSDMPARDKFDYTFDNIARVIDRFTEVIGLDRFAIYVFDYGAPTGFRIAAKHPDRITAIISQNGNAYVEGLSDGWNPIRAYWQDPSEANRTALRTFLSPETTVWQYTHGVADT